LSFLVYGFGKTFFQGSTGIKFSDVAGIDDAVDELQEVWIHGGSLPTFKNLFK
jgi:hypothetical protein